MANPIPWRRLTPVTSAVRFIVRQIIASSSPAVFVDGEGWPVKPAAHPAGDQMAKVRAAGPSPWPGDGGGRRRRTGQQIIANLVPHDAGKAPAA
jgi:hypothetical protein